MVVFFAFKDGSIFGRSNTAWGNIERIALLLFSIGLKALHGAEG